MLRPLRSGNEMINAALKPWPELLKLMHSIDSTDVNLQRAQTARLAAENSDARITAEVGKVAALWKLELATEAEAAASANLERIESMIKGGKGGGKAKDKGKS